MKKFEADSLEKAYEMATLEFGCSITELSIEVFQQPSNGFLGFGKKRAIICAVCKTDKVDNNSSLKSYKNKSVNIEDVSSRLENSNKDSIEKDCKTTLETKEVSCNVPKVESKEKIISEIKSGLNLLFDNSCFRLEDIKVSFYDDETIFIEFLGEDSALLIGKEGYRYKALSYILFNWINDKFGLMLRLEVAEFLKNQEAAICLYLEPVIEIIKEKGSFKKKPLDEILVHSALKRLREEFPEKYVAVKTNIKKEKYVLVNEYKAREI